MRTVSGWRAFTARGASKSSSWAELCKAGVKPTGMTRDALAGAGAHASASASLAVPSALSARSISSAAAPSDLLDPCTEKPHSLCRGLVEQRIRLCGHTSYRRFPGRRAIFSVRSIGWLLGLDEMLDWAGIPLITDTVLRRVDTGRPSDSAP